MLLSPLSPELEAYEKIDQPAERKDMLLSLSYEKICFSQLREEREAYEKIDQPAERGERSI